MNEVMRDDEEAGFKMSNSLQIMFELFPEKPNLFKFTLQQPTNHLKIIIKKKIH